MKAIRLHARGGAEQLRYEEAPEPPRPPADGEALIRVRACAITPTELNWDLTYQRRDGSSRTPSIPGHDVCGVIEALGAGAAEDVAGGVAVGQEVYGLIDFDRDGSAAELVTVPAADLAPKPRTLDAVHAAAVPLSALTAWQALFDHAQLAAGQHVLIHGAAGGVGVYAVQLARWRGARVTATASARNVGLLGELGANQVVDYAKARFDEVVRDVDVVLDPIGDETLARSTRVVKPFGVIVTLPGPAPTDLAKTAGRRIEFFVVRPDRAELIEIGRLIDQGVVRPILEAVYPLSQAGEAFRRGLAGHARGKIVLQVSG
jgi:NADPH:quinone reductase-like Zn-dependent oxidoreductase